MKNSDLVKFKDNLTAFINELNGNLPDEDIKLLNLSMLNPFLQNLSQLIFHRMVDVNNKNDVLSSKMSFDKMTLADFQYFYDAIKMNEDEKKILIGTLHGLTNFSYPILELFPNDGTFTEASVAGEPVYIVDYYQELLSKAASRFNPFYSSRRLMSFVVRDFELPEIPESQVGLAFSFNFFFVKNTDFIAAWAKEVFRVLRPGGYFIFNFIPQDTVWGLELIEEYRFTAINHVSLANILEQQGYEFIKTTLNPNYASTMLVKKPGDLIPFKLSSATAKIIDKSEPFM